MLFSTVCALGVTTSISDAQLLGDLSDGLVAYYSFNGNANDSVGGNNGTALGNYSFTSLGGVSVISVVGTATEGYGGGGYVQLPSFTGVLSNSITLNIWARNEQTPVFSSEHYFSFGNMWGGNNSLWLGIGGTAISVGYNDTGNNYASLSLDLPSEFYQDWHMLTLVLSPTSLSGYLNGTNFASTNGTFVAPEFDFFNAVASHKWRNFGEQSARLTADLANASIYNRSLAGEEVGTLYAQGVPEPSTYALLLLSGAASLWALKRRKS